MKPNAANEWVKHRYFQWLRNAKQMADKSVDQIAMGLDRFEEFTSRRDFKLLRIEQAEPFKKHLAKLNSLRSGDRLSKADDKLDPLRHARFRALACRPARLPDAADTERRGLFQPITP